MTPHPAPASIAPVSRLVIALGLLAFLTASAALPFAVLVLISDLTLVGP